jgi:hypothetical protein
MMTRIGVSVRRGNAAMQQMRHVAESSFSAWIEPVVKLGPERFFVSSHRLLHMLWLAMGKKEEEKVPEK